MKTATLISHLAVLLIGAFTGYLIANNSNKPTTLAETKPPTKEVEHKPATTEPDAEVADTAATAIEEGTPAEPPAENTDPTPERRPAPGPLPNLPTASVTNLPAADQCFSSDDQLGYQLSLFSEELEKDALWYDDNNPDKFQNNSGIFHRIANFVKSKCDRYDYPPHSLRGSVNLADWYNNRKTLTPIKNTEDGVAQRNLIRPGSVMFFGKSGKNYNDLTLEKVTKDDNSRIIDHMGVVTAVEKDENGDVKGYVMLHGRGDGKTAQRTHYHSTKPAGFGMPPLGNYNQQWVAISSIRTPKSDISKYVETEDIIPSPEDIATTYTINNSPGSGVMACFPFDFDKYFYDDVALVMEKKKIGYKIGERADCSGIVYRVCEMVGDKMEGDCSEDLKLPCEDGYRDSRSLAKWYYENGNLQVVNDPKKMGDLIKVGSVMFFGQNGHKYNKKITMEDLEKGPKPIQHVGVVAKIEKDDEGNVVKYHMFHGHGNVGSPADITGPSLHNNDNQSQRNDRMAYSYWKQQWVAVAPSILTVKN